MADGTLPSDDDLSKYPATRKEALATGARFYLPAKPCIRGHRAKRVISSGQCAECIKVLSRNNEYYKKYQKQWQIDNRDRIRANRVPKNELEKLTFPWKSLLKEAKSRAKQFDRVYALTEDWATDRWTGLCELTGIAFQVRSGNRTGQPFSPSIDRIDSRQGYTATNCRFVLLAINRLKGILGDAQMLQVADALVTSSWASQQRQLPASDLGEYRQEGL